MTVVLLLAAWSVVAVVVAVVLGRVLAARDRQVPRPRATSEESRS